MMRVASPTAAAGGRQQQHIAAVSGGGPLAALRRLLELLLALALGSRAGDGSAALRLLATVAGFAAPALALLALRQLWRQLFPHRPASLATDGEGAACCICQRKLVSASSRSTAGAICRLPQGRGLARSLEGKQCYLGCVVGGKSAGESPLPKDVAEELWQLAVDSPELWKRSDQTVRLCYEDLRLERASELGRPSPAPSLLVWAFEGVREVRISSCALRSLPKELGRLRALRSLVLFSCELREVPQEVGELCSLEQLYLNGNFLRQLPKCVGDLPSLSEVCVDANQLVSLPRFNCPKFKMLTAAGNLLQRPPEFASTLERLELHGNLLSALPGGSNWGRLRSLKAMGNQLHAMPASMASSLQWIEYLNLSDNCLQSLPEEMASLRYLESLFVYNNQLRTLPRGLLLSTRIRRLLLEGNPLEGACLVELAEDAEDSRAQVQTLAIDEPQARAMAAFTPEGAGALQPMCITVGNLIRAEGSSHSDGMYLKLARASQLRRSPGCAIAGTPGGPPSCSEAPAEVLVVAFAASQGEPEWLGLLRALPGVPGALEACPPPVGPLSAYVGGAFQAKDDSRFSALWRPAGGDGDELAELSSEDDAQVGGEGGEPIPDFDVLIACDGRMRWYSEDAEAVERALAGVCARYRRRLFVGASMGGYGALRHGARLADAVLAFGPQTLLAQAVLRPPGLDRNMLEAHTTSVIAAVRAARARGAEVQVHCAADTHLEHAYSLPLDDLGLVIHPLLPRVPFARLLDRAEVLWPIVGSAIQRLLIPVPGEGPVLPEANKVGAEVPARVCVARWGPGKLLRYYAGREEARAFFFDHRAPKLPRPGDWYCTQCSGRNMKLAFFCGRCASGGGDRKLAPNVADQGVRKVAGQGYPRRGDWGCGVCGSAMQARDKRCSHCNLHWNDPRHVVVE